MGSLSAKNASEIFSRLGTFNRREDFLTLSDFDWRCYNGWWIFFQTKIFRGFLCLSLISPGANYKENEWSSEVNPLNDPFDALMSALCGQNPQENIREAALTKLHYWFRYFFSQTGIFLWFFKYMIYLTTGDNYIKMCGGRWALGGGGGRLVPRFVC